MESVYPCKYLAHRKTFILVQQVDEHFFFSITFKKKANGKMLKASTLFQVSRFDSCNVPLLLGKIRNIFH